VDNHNGIAMQIQLKSSGCPARSSSTANLIAIITITIALVVVTYEAIAHHPGSHAKREAGSVVIDAVAVINDDCTKALGVEAGAPPNSSAVANRVLATLRLEHSSGANCKSQAGRVSARGAVQDVVGADQVHLYIVDQSNKLLATERIPIR
jgi:hypothetical protein